MGTHKGRIFAGLIVPLLISAACAQDREAAAAAFQAHRWNEAVAAYSRLTAANPNDGEAWYQLGLSLYSANRFPEAASGFKHAAELKFRPVLSTYNAAASLARAGRTDDALGWLEKLPALGYRGVRQLEQDADFAPIRSSQRFQGVLVALRANVAPCEHAELNRQFDFWVGEWDVQTAQGQHVGDSSVQKILGGCVILENWTGSASQGKSFNVYNSALQKWQQYWVDDSGTATVYTGELIGNQMRYIAAAGAQNGNVERRLTFTQLNDKRVRQLGESSSDGGNTWTVAYDLFYVRKP
jgi:hypothetical protein